MLSSSLETNHVQLSSLTQNGEKPCWGQTKLGSLVQADRKTVVTVVLQWE